MTFDTVSEFKKHLKPDANTNIQRVPIVDICEILLFNKFFSLKLTITFILLFSTDFPTYFFSLYCVSTKKMSSCTYSRFLISNQEQIVVFYSFLSVFATTNSHLCFFLAASIYFWNPAHWRRLKDPYQEDILCLLLSWFYYFFLSNAAV